MTSRKKLLTAIIAAVTAAILFFAVYIIICAAQPPEEITLSENKTVIYANDGAEFFTLARFGRNTEIPYDIMRQFAGKEKSNIASHLSGLLGIKGRYSASELLAVQLCGEDDYLVTLKHAKYLEQHLTSENEIMKYYCLSVDFGNGVYGLDRAAIYYFGKRADELSDKEISALRKISLSSKLLGKTPDDIALINAFDKLSFNDNYKYSVLDGSAYISALCGDVKKFLAENGYSYEQACEMLYDGGLKIYSCHNSAIQSALDSVITNGDDDNDFQMAMQIMDYDGHVAAVSGGIGNSLINRAAIPRAVGSSIKPLSVYTPAIDEGMINYSSIVSDVPFDIANGWPRNFDNLYEGTVTAARALRRSKNTFPVLLADSMGLEKCADYLERLGCAGLTENDRMLSALSLGYFDSGVSIAELCAAYQVFGSGGVFYEPTFFTQIENTDGVVLAKEIKSRQVFSPQTAYIMNRMMKSNVDMPDGLGTSAHIDGVEVFGKTGTTDNSFGVINNKTFAGGTPDYVGALWIGPDDKNTAQSLSFIPLNTHVWNMVFSRLDTRADTFSQPSGVTSALFCCESGLLAVNGCAETETGWYKSGEIPVKCNIHGNN